MRHIQNISHSFRRGLLIEFPQVTSTIASQKYVTTSTHLHQNTFANVYAEVSTVESKQLWKVVGRTHL